MTNLILWIQKRIQTPRKLLQHWPMIVLVLLSVPSAAFLMVPAIDIAPIVEEVYVDTSGLYPAVEKDFTAKDVVDSIFLSIQRGSSFFPRRRVADPNSRFAEWMWYVKVREGYMAKEYRCPAGIRTIGYGHNVQAHGHTEETKDGKVSYSEASDVLYFDIQKQYDQVNKLLPKLSKNQKLAITSLAANCGIAKIMYRGGSRKKGYSDFWLAAKAGKVPNFAAYTRYRQPDGKVVKSPNLVSARNFERLLFQGYGKAAILTGFRKGKPIFQMLTFDEAAEVYKNQLIKRDILPAKYAGNF